MSDPIKSPASLYFAVFVVGCGDPPTYAPVAIFPYEEDAKLWIEMLLLDGKRMTPREGYEVRQLLVNLRAAPTPEDVEKVAQGLEELSGIRRPRGKLVREDD